MGVRDVAGVFSRFFVVGFFLPAFFTGAVLDQISDGGLLPSAYQDAPGTRLAIFGGIALLFGLILSALHQSLLDVFAGRALVPSFVRRGLTYRWLHRFERLEAAWHESAAASRQPGWRGAGDVEQFTKLDDFLLKFGSSAKYVQPTRFGNALAAGGRLIVGRWGLDPAVAWPRVQTLLGPEQHQLEADARTDLAFLTNGAVGATTVSLVAAGNWLAGGAWNGRGLGIAGGVVVAVAFYRLASNAAHKWVVDVQGSFVDTYRYELYGRLGVSKPDSHAEELRVADQLSTFLRRGLRGEDLFGSSSSDGAPRDK